MECPSPECKQSHEELKEYVYGKGGPDRGLMSKIYAVEKCLNKKVPKSWLLTFIAAFGIAIIGSSYHIYSRVEAGEILHNENVKNIAKNAEQISKLTTVANANEIHQKELDVEIRHISSTLCEIKEMLKNQRGRHD